VTLPGWVPSILMALLNLWQAYEWWREGSKSDVMLFVCYAFACVALAWGYWERAHGQG
jgi:hypothetical protein